MPEFVSCVIAAAQNRVDLNLSQIAVLGACAGPRRPDLKSRELHAVATYLKMSKPAVVRAVDKLGDLGLRKRLKHEADARRCILTVTDAGDEVLAALKAGERPGNPNVLMRAA